MIFFYNNFVYTNYKSIHISNTLLVFFSICINMPSHCCSFCKDANHTIRYCSSSVPDQCLTRFIAHYITCVKSLRLSGDEDLDDLKTTIGSSVSIWAQKTFSAPQLRVLATSNRLWAKTPPTPAPKLCNTRAGS